MLLENVRKRVVLARRQALVHFVERLGLLERDGPLVDNDIVAYEDFS